MALKNATYMVIPITLLVLFLCMLFNSEAISKTMLPDRYKMEKGVWIWESPNYFSDQEISEMLVFASQHNVNTLYVRIDEYIDLIESNDSKEIINQKISEFINNLRSFNKLAHQYGIKVEALGGHSYWSEDSHYYITPILIDFVDSFNKDSESDQKFTGIQFDVEPHGQDEFDDNQEQSRILKNYVTYVKDTVEYAVSNTSGLRIGFVIPYWYDQQTRQLTPVTYNGVTQPVFNHIISILNKNSQKIDTYVVVMSYRNFAQGSNGTIELTEYEINYTEPTQVKILVGQETTDVKPARITFYGLTSEYMDFQLDLIKKQFTNSKSFGGFAIHDLRSWMQLHSGN